MANELEKSHRQRSQFSETCDRKALNYLTGNVPLAFMTDHASFLGDFGFVCRKQQVAGANSGTFQSVFLAEEGLKLVRWRIAGVKCLALENYDLLLSVYASLV